MFNFFVKLALAPVLLVQGRRVKRETPRLPEATGCRLGTIAATSNDSKHTKSLRILICGDSAAAGVGVENQQQALAGCLERELQTRFPQYDIHWTLWATNGDTSAVALIKLHLRQTQEFDLVITSLGVNDVTRGLADYRFFRQQQALVRLFREKYSARQILLTAVPPMRHFPALPQPLRWYLGRQAERLNAQLQRVAQLDSMVEVVDVNFPLQADVIASDGFHPGPVGYQLWAKAVADRVRQ
ncbi:MAG: SGNH/GDSL hydrolase family protein [Aliidiomarina sp.]|uniref:SGNH/GDSL hydrolase family protein n=1 Tax=Aliidiomarina sp. TaxID=1872439 RepID=UPI0025B835C6|nr:SGNH/GDSL hydrolase family protein [Aliidiomarina sp.]MCH8502140.1 SGNH/GDSL hydrolase family protein [Aliidiomarina sp.]